MYRLCGVRTLVRIVVTVFLIMLAACDDDCPLCPEETEDCVYYHLLYSYVVGDGIGAPYYSLTLDSRTGDIVDSTAHTTEPFNDVVFSPDGKYAYYTGWGFTMATDYSTGDTIAIDRGTAGQRLELSADGDFLLRSNGVALFSLPDLEVRFLGPGEGNAVFHPAERVAYFGDCSSESLFVLDYQETPPVVSAVPLVDETGFGFAPSLLAISPDGTQLAVTSSGMRLCFLDLNTFTVTQAFGNSTDPCILSSVRLFI